MIEGTWKLQRGHGPVKTHAKMERDASARCFTLTMTVSDYDAETSADGDVEGWCERVLGEALQKNDAVVRQAEGKRQYL